MWEIWKRRLTAILFTANVVLYVSSVWIYQNQSVQYYFIGTDPAQNQGPIWKVNWVLLVLLVFFVICWRYRARYTAGQPLRFFQYELACFVTEQNALIFNNALQSFFNSINIWIQVIGFQYCLQLFVQRELSSAWIIPVTIGYFVVIFGVVCFRFYKGIHEQ